MRVAPVVAATCPLPLGPDHAGVVVPTTPEELPELAGRTRLVGLVVRSECVLNAALVTALPHLRFVIRAGSGFDAIDQAALAERDVDLVRNPAPSAEAVAELAWTGLLSLTRRIPVATSALRRGEHVKHRLVGDRLAGLSIAVWGSGPVGRAVGAAAGRWGAEDVRFVDTRPGQAGAERLQSTDPAVSTMDVHVVCLRLVPETWRMFDERFFARVRDKRPYLCNVGRYDLVDMAAASAALARDGLRGLHVDPIDVAHLPDAARIAAALDGRNVLFTQHQGAQRRDVRAELDSWALTEAVDRLTRVC